MVIMAMKVLSLLLSYACHCLRMADLVTHPSQNLQTAMLWLACSCLPLSAIETRIRHTMPELSPAAMTGC